MHWLIGLLLFMMALMPLSFSLRPGHEVFSETGAAYEVDSGETIRFGKLLIGSQDIVSDNKMETAGWRSAKQSDESKFKEEARFHLAKTKLQHLNPSVHCGNDSMTLQVPGPRTPHFLVDQGEGSSLPLSEMPARCGFSLKRARRDVSLVAPYSGCNVQKQGGNYILPLIIMGAQVQMSCPVSPLLPKVSCLPSAMTLSLGARADDVKIKVAGSWEPLLLSYSKCSITQETVDGSVVITVPFTGSCWEIKDLERHLPLLYGEREVTLSCPVTPPTLAPTLAPTVPPTVAPSATPAAVQDPLDIPQMFYPFPFGRPWWYPPYAPGVPPVPATQPPPPPPTTTAATTTTTTTTAAAPLPGPIPHEIFPQMYPMPMFHPYFYPKGAPGASPAPPHPWNPMFPPYFYGFNSPVEPTTPAATTTTTTTTTTAAAAAAAPVEQQAGYPMYPMFFGPQSIKSPGVQYPFMPYYPQQPAFAPRSLNSVSPRSSSIYRSRRQQLNVR